MVDLCLRAHHKRARIELCVALTTQVCRSAQAAHHLEPVATIALGRLLTAVGLNAVTSKRTGTTSFQVISRGRFRQIYADATHQGHLRGMVRGASGLGLTRLPGETPRGRHAIGHLVLPGEVSVIRLDAQNQYSQSSISLASGELDEDIESYLHQSDQIPTVLRTDVLLEADKSLAVAGGVFAQLLPDGDPAELEKLRTELAHDGFARHLAAHAGDAKALLAAVAQEAELVEQPLELIWRCRCSHERAAASLKMFQPSELASMIEEQSPVDVDCDLCGTKYQVSVQEITRAFQELVKAEG